MPWQPVLKTAANLTLAMFLAAPAAGDIAFITNQNSNSVSLLDLSKGQKTREIPVPGKPAGVQVIKDLGLFTVGPDDKTLRRFGFNGEANGVLTLDGGPLGIAALGQTIFVSDWFNARIWQIDGATLTVTAELTTGAAPAGLAVSPDGKWLISADRDADSLSVFALPAGTLHRQIRVGTRPFAVSFDADGRVYAANVGSNDVTVADPNSGEIITTLPVGTRPYGVAFAAGRIFVTNQYADTLSVFDHASFAPVATLDTGEYPEGINSFDNGSKLIVANWFSNTATVFDAITLETLTEIETGDGPRAFGLFILED